MLVVLYLLNLLPAFLLAWGFRSALLEGLGDSMSAEAILGGFDFTVFSDFLNHHGETLSPIYAQVFAAIGIYALVSVFTAGGILSVLSGTEGSLRNFFMACGDLFPRFFRLFLIFILVASVAGFVAAALLGIFHEIITDGAASEKPEILWFLAAVGIWVAIIMLIGTIGDYAKIDTVCNDRGKMLRAFWRATKFVLRRFLPVVGLQLLIFILVLLLVGLYWSAESLFETASAAAVVLLFILQQAFVGSRIWARVFSFASQRELFFSFHTQENAVSLPTPEPLAGVPESRAPKKRIPGRRRPVRKRAVVPRRKRRK
jgi:hypothetical protein